MKEKYFLKIHGAVLNLLHGLDVETAKQKDKQIRAGLESLYKIIGVPPARLDPKRQRKEGV